MEQLLSGTGDSQEFLGRLNFSVDYDTTIGVV